MHARGFEKICDIDLSPAIVTPHPVWGKLNLSAFYVPNMNHGREVIEMFQRFGFEYETVLIDRNWDTNKWGLGDFYDRRGGIWDDAMMMQNLENALCSDRHFDVMVIPGINGWRRFTEKARAAILRRVEEGAGLIIHTPRHGLGMPEVVGSMPAEAEDRADGHFSGVGEKPGLGVRDGYRDPVLEALSPLAPLHEEGYRPDGYCKIDKFALGHEDWAFGDHYITNGFPAELFDFAQLGYYPYDANGEVIIRSKDGQPIAAVKSHGKGRIVAFGFLPTAFLPDIIEVQGGGCFGSKDLADTPPELNISFDPMEYFYLLLGKAMLWAAGKEAPAIRKAEVVIKDGKATLQLDSDAPVTYRVKNLYDETLLEGTAQGTLELPAYLCGQLRLELLTDADWRVLPFELPLTAQVESVDIDAPTPLSAGDALTATALYTGQIEGMTCVLQLYDDFNNLWVEEKAPLVPGQSTKVTLTYPVAPTLSLNLRVTASVLCPAGDTVHKLETPRRLVTPFSRDIDDFEAFLSPCYKGRASLQLLIGECFRTIGVTGLYPGGNRVVSASGAEGLGIYWYKRAKYVQRKEAYMATGDKQFLVRLPCLSDPDFWGQLEPVILETVEKNKVQGPISYFANDEGSLTCYSDELELCFCPHCMAGMREWLKSQYADLAELNAKWGSDFAAWDEVMPDTYDEASAKNNFRAWGDHRLYMEKVFCGAYEKIISLVRQQDPGGRLRMSGCQASTPFTGADYYELHKHIGYFEAYGGGNQWEFHRSFMQKGTILGGWTGYGISGINARYQIWNATLHALTLHSMFWHFSNQNPDYTLPKTATDLSKPLIELRREGLGKLLNHASTRDALGLAVHYSMRSVHGSYAKGNEKTFTGNREGWVNVLEDCGYQYNFIATPQIEDGELAGYKALILPYSIDLTDKEAAAIKTFVQNGGVVIGDFQAGAMYVGTREQAPLDDVFGVERRNNHNRHFFTDGEVFAKPDFDLFPIPTEMTGCTFAEEGIRTAPGAIQGFYLDMNPAVSALVINEYGKGKGIYLNLALSIYVEARKKGGQAIRDLIKGVLGYAGIVKFATITDPATGEPVESGLETVYYSAPGAKYAAVLRELRDDRSAGHDGLVVGTASAAEGEGLPARLTFPEAAHIYDVREKKYLGHVEFIDTTLVAGDVRLLALLPERREAVTMDLPATLDAGQAFDLTLAVDHAQSAVFALNVTQPDGTWDFMLSQNLATDGKTTLNLRLPLNAPKGAWVFKAKDVATGLTVEKTVTVK